MFGLPNNDQAAPAASPAVQPAPAASPAVAQPAAQPTAQPVAQPGDQKYNKIMEAMMTSSIGGKRNEMPVGSGLFLVKEGMFKLTPTQGLKLTSFQLYCVKGVSDGQGLTPASPQYTGPRVGETYEYAVFHNSKWPDMLGRQYLQITAACMGWSEARVAELQASAEGQQAIAEMTARILCVDTCGNQVMDEAGKPVSSIISNQAIVDIAHKSQIKDKKVDKQLVYEKGSDIPIKITVKNVYWNKRIWLDDLVAQGITEEELLKAFGSQEAATAAYQIEQTHKQGC